MQVVAGLETIRGIAGEWKLSLKRVHKGSGRIAAAHVTVDSVHEHKPAPPPQSTATANGGVGHDHSHAHSSNSHAHDDAQQTATNSNESSSNSNSSSTAAHTHNHSHEHAGAPLRNFDTVKALLEDSELPAVVKQRSIAVFHALAEAGEASAAASALLTAAATACAV